jgi:DNA-binding transcriptional regulator YiaG
VRALRNAIGASQSVFASMVGVSPDLVQSWEQGIRALSPLACRLLETIELDPVAFKTRVFCRGEDHRPRREKRRAG